MVDQLVLSPEDLEKYRDLTKVSEPAFVSTFGVKVHLSEDVPRGTIVALDFRGEVVGIYREVSDGECQ